MSSWESLLICISYPHINTTYNFQKRSKMVDTCRRKFFSMRINMLETTKYIYLGKGLQILAKIDLMMMVMKVTLKQLMTRVLD